MATAHEREHQRGPEDYFPKGSDLRQHAAEDLARVQNELNERPRKVLDWDTPAERLGISNASVRRSWTPAVRTG